MCVCCLMFASLVVYGCLHLYNPSLTGKMLRNVILKCNKTVF